VYIYLLCKLIYLITSLLSACFAVLSGVILAGGPLGTALMAACTMGWLEVVKFLVGRGAKTEYAEDGKPMVSAYEGAVHHKVWEWLVSNQGHAGT